MLFGMSIADKIRSAAMDVVLTWGPERSRPEMDRLRDKFPDVDDATASEALKDAARVLSEAESGAASAKSGNQRGLENALRKNRAWLTAEQASQAVNQGMYYHWRETGE